MPDREVWSFFTGAMGLDLGLEHAGIHTTLAVEVNATCCATIRHNRPNLDVWETDVTSLTGSGLKSRRANPNDVFLMVGGPPCQSFSSGGKRAGLSDPRGNLIYAFLKLIGEVRPCYFVLENVAQIVTAALRHRPIAERPGKHWNLAVYERKTTVIDDNSRAMAPDELSGSAIRQVFADMKDLGYHLNFAVHDAADYGAPQHRYRFIMIGSRESEAPPLPLPTHGLKSLNAVPWKTVRDAIYDLRYNPGAHSSYTPKVAKYFALVPPGGNWRDLPRELQQEALGEAAFAAGGGKTGFYRRLSWDRPSPTITGRSNRKGSAACHPEFTRPLSVKECARLQGFPDDWAFVGAMNRQYLQIGNAVPVHLGAAIGQALCGDKNSSHRPLQTRFELEALLTTAVARLRGTARNKRIVRSEPTLF